MTSLVRATEGVSFANPSPESVVLWCVLLSHFREKGDFDMTDKLQPELSAYADAVGAAIKVCTASATSARVFIAQELLKAGHALDYSDEVGRRRLFALLREHLQDIDMHGELVQHMLALVVVLHPNDGDNLRIVAEVIAALTETADAHATSTNLNQTLTGKRR